ncbi:hypothetical protein RvY_00319 [Ramazzottius varieornatus]|uniref:Protein YIPF n=1 Tax=Ramazzottius varieornatus TaxID=947166 RepID=A0A1D1UCD6_RAMVA|nr:hypothetical protein RvY_00319 [Ramazzottius varieornatus]
MTLQGTNFEAPPSYPGSFVEGDMDVPSAAAGRTGPSFEDLNTLDEPIKDTVFRDVKAIGQKFFHVLIPHKGQKLLRDWDLWGPLILCTFVAIMLQGANADKTADNNAGPEFAQIFLLVALGSVIVTLNSKLLGGNISFFQSVCILGYCLLPEALALIACRIFAIALHGTVLFALRTTVITVGFLWATWASVVFLGDTQQPNRKALSVYPIFLFYLIISWLIMSQTGHN